MGQFFPLQRAPYLLTSLLIVEMTRMKWNKIISWIKTKSIFPNIHNWAAHNGHQRQETLLKSLKRGNDIYKDVKVVFESRCNVRPSPKQDAGCFGRIVFFLVFREERQRKILGWRGGRKWRAKSAPPFTLISSFSLMLWKRMVKVTAIPCCIGALKNKTTH